MRHWLIVAALAVVAGCATSVATCDGPRDGGIGGTGGCVKEAAN